MTRTNTGGVAVALLLAAIVVTCLWVVPAADASFGLNNFDVVFANQDGSPASQAGSHPYAMSTSFNVNTQFDPELGYEIPAGDVKDMTFEQILGLVGDVGATPRCKTSDFLSGPSGTLQNPRVDNCPDSAAVGTVKIDVSSSEAGDEPFFAAVYNLEPPPGVAARLGFIASFTEPVIIELRVSKQAPYRVVASLTDVAQPLRFFATKLTLWGNPADPSHDALRGYCISQLGKSRGNCPSTAGERPFLTLPTNCSGPLTTSFQADSWEEPGVWATGAVETHDGSQPPAPLGMTGCGKLAFKPQIDAQPTAVSAQSPTGLNFKLDVHDAGLTSPTGVAQSDIKRVVVSLPEGMSANPALAEGLQACGESDLSRETIGSQPGEGCPEQSKIGTVEVETPLLEETVLKGSLFLAKPYENPFGSLLALYVVVKDPRTGILLKLPGEVIPNETTGQLVSVFDDLPQLPFSHLRLNFREGQRSPLVTPSACGTYTADAQMTPWANPETLLHETASFQVTSGVGGGPCPASGAPPFAPSVIAGTSNNSAGAYSPLDLRVTRNDGEQEITGFSTTLPAGLTANLTGVPFCSEAQIALASTKTGAQEEAQPSCPTSSQIGHTLVGVGVGSVLSYAPGKLYMGGPFEGDPFSIVAISAAKIGPFDLGTVIVHLPLTIDPRTAVVSVPAGAADQIPHILKGIVIHVRDIRVYVDRPNFIVNPTSCAPSTLTANVIGSGASFTSPADDLVATVGDHFQAANCANLAFKPKFSASTSARISRTNGASLTVKLTYPKGSFGAAANVAKAKVELPRRLPSRLTTLQQACPDNVFDANPAACPAASRVGYAKALTPILPVAVEGPAYFVSHGGVKFPELIVVLQGYGVTVYLRGETFISPKGITSSTFRSIPDVPVDSFQLTLPQGPYSALGANGSLCNGPLIMPTSLIAQNGLALKQATRVSVSGCGKRTGKRRGHRR